MSASSKRPKPGEAFEDFVDRKRAQRMNAIDNLSPALRELVHDYGYTVVRAFLDMKVTEARHIKHLVETVLNEFSPTRGSYSRQGIRTPADEARP